MKHLRLHLDYIERATRLPWSGVLLLAVALAIAADLALRLREARSELSRIAADQELRHAERPAVRRAPGARLEQDAKTAENVVRELTLPWATLLETLEAASAREVAILQIQPEAPRQLLRIMAEARNHQAMLGYLDRLSASGKLRDVHLVNHQKQQDDPQRPLQFVVHANLHSPAKATP
jgi:hypothetical protein